MSIPTEPNPTPAKIDESLPDYEAPQIIDLNRLTIGHGACVSGSADAEYCTVGTGGFNFTSCNGGGSPDDPPPTLRKNQR